MLDYFIAFVSSDLFFSISGAAFGAAGGALAIREIDQREKRKKTLSNLNSGIVLISNALSTLLSFKRNMVISMCMFFAGAVASVVHFNFSLLQDFFSSVFLSECHAC